MNVCYANNIHCISINALMNVAVAIQCPPGMVYQQCGPLCPQTCNNIETSNCQGGCAEGCFCPDRQVLSDGRCIDPIACPGLYITVLIVVCTEM